MYIVLSTTGQQAIMDAATQGYKLTLGKAALFRTTQDLDQLPYPITLSEVDTNILSTWDKVADNLTAIDEYNPVTPEIFQVVVNVPFNLGDFKFDAIALYLDNGTLLGVGCYSIAYDKVAPALEIDGNKMELEVFIRHASIAGVMNVTRQVALHPYSYITEYDTTDQLGKASDNNERIYRITRPTNALNDGNNQFTTFLAHAGIAFFDGQNKPYQSPVWVPSDHISMFGHAALRARIINGTSVSIFVPKDTYPMIEHVIAEVPYLLATTQYGSSPLPNAVLGGLLLESVLSTLVDTDPDFYEFVFQLTNTTFTGSFNQDFGVILYALNTDLAAQTAVRVALKKFLEMQYDIGRTYKSDQDTDPNLVLKPFLGYDTYWRKLDGVVEVATSTTDGRIASAGQLYDLPDYATGGETLLAPVLRATNIWLRYDPSSSETITYQLGVDRTTVNEGGTINATLLTTGLTNGSLVAYTISGIQQADLSSGTLTGYFTVNNNVATLAFGIAADNLTEGTETFNIKINADPTAQANVTINDTSITVSVNSYYANDPAAASSAAITNINEGQSCYYVATVVGIPNGTYLYPRISNTGTAIANDLTQAIPNSVVVTNGRVSFPINVSADRLTEGNEQLIIGLYKASTIIPSNLLTLKTLTINDTSLTPDVNCYFYTDTTSPNPTPVSQVNEGRYVYLNILTTGYAAGTVFALSYPTDVDRPVSPGDFSTVRPTTATINSQGRAVVAYYIANDNVTEEYSGGVDTETFAVQIRENVSDPIPVAQAQVLIKDTSKLTSGSFMLVDITDPLNPVPFFNSEVDQLSNISYSSTGGGGLDSRTLIAGSIFPLDICLMLGRKYRLIWIQSATPTSAVTRAVCGIYGAVDYGVGLGSDQTDSATDGKPLAMLNDSGGNPIGYGAVFEFAITKINTDVDLPISQPFNMIMYTYYPDGIPGYSTPSDPPVNKWATAKEALITHKENNDAVRIKNLYSSVNADWTSFCAKELTIPFGTVADFFIVLPGGSGATSSLASSGTGLDGAHGHDFQVHFPKYLGKDGLKDNVSSIAPTRSSLYFPLFNTLGGDGGKGQLFSASLTNLGGTARSTIAIDSSAVTNVEDLITSPTKGLFGLESNRTLDYDIIFEVLQVIDGRDWQLGNSTSDNHNGGFGILPSGLSNSAGNYRGGGGKGGDTVGTGTGYGGGGSSGAIVMLRLGTRVNTAGFTPIPTLAPVSFFITDKTTVDAITVAGTTPLSAGLKPFAKATTDVLAGSNAGSQGSEFYIAQMSYETDAKTFLEQETLVGAGTPICFVRPTHNDLTYPTLPLRGSLAWDKEQIQQITVPKLGISRIVINATGVEGSYVDGSSATVDGMPSNATNVLTKSTVSPAYTANETVGSTFVYFAGASANTDGGAPTINTGKLSVYQNLMVSNYRTANGTDAVANGDNTYSRGGFIDLYLTNYNSKSGSVFVELPRVDLSLDNPLLVSDTDNYAPDTWWSSTTDADGNAISSHNYMIAAGDGALSVQPYSLSSIVSIRPWVRYEMKDATPTDKNAPIIIQQGEAVILTVVGGGGAVSTRAPDGGVTTPDPAFNGDSLILQVKGLANDTYTTFLTCYGGTGSIDDSTLPNPASIAVYSATPLNGILTVIEDPTLTNGATNPIKAVHGGDGSGSYAKIKLLNHNATPVTIKAIGGKGGSGESTLQVSDGIVIVDVM